MSDAPFHPVCPPPRSLVRPVRTDPTGRAGPTKDQARGSKWTRVGPNAYVPAATDRTLPEQRILEASTLLPDTGAVTGWASLRLAGAAYFDGLGRDGRSKVSVPLAVGGTQGRRTHPGTTLSYERLEPREVVVRHGVPATTTRRALFDEMRRTGDWRDAVVTMDMAAAAGLVSIRMMRAYLHSHRRWRRAHLVERALALASEHSWSPAEPRVRMLWVVDAGSPRHS